MESFEGWNSLELNQMVRSLQPDIIINNRSLLEEDFQTPEGRIVPAGRDWEACMTFNGISWGYLDYGRVLPFRHSAQQIVRTVSYTHLPFVFSFIVRLVTAPALFLLPGIGMFLGLRR